MAQLIGRTWKFILFFFFEKIVVEICKYILCDGIALLTLCEICCCNIQKLLQLISESFYNDCSQSNHGAVVSAFALIKFEFWNLFKKFHLTIFLKWDNNTTEYRKNVFFTFKTGFQVGPAFLFLILIWFAIIFQNRFGLDLSSEFANCIEQSYETHATFFLFLCFNNPVFTKLLQKRLFSYARSL